MRRLPIHQSLHRHTHLMGAERELVMGSALIALLVGIGGLTLVSVGAAFVFWLLALICLRLMAKADPIMSKVWLRHVKQQDLYLAASSRWRPRDLGGFRCSR